MKIFQRQPAVFTLALIIFLFTGVFSCNTPEPKPKPQQQPDTLSEAQKRLPENALKGLTVAGGLEVLPFAAEPMLQNPTNMDVDEKGRVWITEAYNYRPAVNGNPTNPLGDRIIILEDTNGDGHADTTKVFYQGPEINAPLGICVLGNRVIVSQSPYVWSFYDDNGDDKADRKEILFQGIGGEQHDHGAHAFSFGVDGKLYFNFGNEAHTLKDKSGKDVLDQDGDVIGPKKYRQGMVFRCNPDGSQVECLGDNFRNPYEVAVDSYGALWQSDNDDDGNRGTRINFVMPNGNYGYTDEMTGASWQSSRTNMEDSIPLRHWHLNDPGEVPNLLQTFAGSPTGMVVYEGDLLPATFRNQLIHCDAGPNVVRSYLVQKSGAGYTATIENILKGDKDPWFRPADVSVAPDGSLYIADWYDPGVGGHAAGDQVRGRVYRVAPPGAKYKQPKLDFTTAAGAVTALQNPNLSVRFHAFSALQLMGQGAVPELEKCWKENSNPRMRARALWALLKMPGADLKRYLAEAAGSENPDFRIAAIRAAVEIKQLELVLPILIADQDIAVRREAALALYHQTMPMAAEWWTSLAIAHDGKDRWYLEALGIGADNQWDKFLVAYLEKVKDPLATAAGKDIIWRARSEKAIPYLAKLAADPTVSVKERQRYFRAFDFNSGPTKYALLLNIIKGNQSQDVALNKLVLHALDVATVKKSPVAQKALKQVIDSVKGTSEFIELLSRFSVKTENKTLLHMAITDSSETLGQDAAGLLLQFDGQPLVIKTIKGKDSLATRSLLASLGYVGSKRSVDLLQSIALSKSYKMDVRKQAASKIGKSGTGENRVLEILKQHKVPKELIPDVVASVDEAWMKSVRDEAAGYLPQDSKSKLARNAPTMEDLKGLVPDPEKGKTVFSNNCGTCHKVPGMGLDFGPNLSEIGSKLPREGLLEAIVHPSAGIGFGYEGWTFKMKDGSGFSGLIVSKTETDIEVKFPGGSHKKFKANEVVAMEEMKSSMMTDGLYQNMSNQDLANLLDYLSSLKKK
ncbi:PVC-type heme-binding CxxCH protein [Flavihumibacter profundi]|uniref:PVC-type heme-binding CxxCH protein n=1 Tax=Flavihumibacter profundi TaxID=2716883 RepID=UPI001CC70061|nr:PVC-type heme-binding CxxCH protein [Flavihumibacter profundi]MBZ5857005.1 HEAT repeat domain-containing protein [Flavihumibacter profundi]